MEKWNIVARFFQSADAIWLDDFIDDPCLSFTKIPARKNDNWHHSSRSMTSIGQWLSLLGQGWRAFGGAPDGIITCFPQLAVVVSVIKRLRLRRTRVIAHNFNLGSFPGGLKRAFARFAAHGIDLIIVHSPSEAESYAKYLGVDPIRVKFVPLQRGQITVPRAEDVAHPFILAMGSAGRDYATLIKAVDELKIRTIIVTRKDIIDALPHSNHIEFRHGLTQSQCHDLLAAARLSVVPVANLTTASGQVTFINSMMLSVPLIATRCPRTEGYVENEVTGLLVDPADEAGMIRAIERLWSDPALRTDLSTRAAAFAHANLRDEAAAETLKRLIHEGT